MASSLAIRLPAVRATDVYQGVDWIPVLFVMSLCAILGFAGVDTFLNLKYPVHVAVELNPMARWLLRASDNNLALFMAVKWVGTTTALSVLVALYERRRGMALAVACAVAVCVNTMLIYMIA